MQPRPRVSGKRLIQSHRGREERQERVPLCSVTLKYLLYSRRDDTAGAETKVSGGFWFGKVGRGRLSFNLARIETRLRSAR